MAGIAGFINGVFQGMDWREGREDRARVRKMQDEEFGWRREDQEWQRSERDYTRSERARTDKEREDEKALRRRAGDAYADMLFGPSAIGVMDAVSPDATRPPAPSPADYSMGTIAPAAQPAATVAPLGVVGVGAAGPVGVTGAAGSTVLPGGQGADRLSPAAVYPNYSAVGGPQAPGVGNPARPGDYQAQATSRRIAEAEAARDADPTVAMGDEALYANAARAMVKSAEQSYAMAQQALAAEPTAANQARATEAAKKLAAARAEAANLAAAPVPQPRQTYSVRSILAAEGPEATGRAAPMPASSSGQTAVTASGTPTATPTAGATPPVASAAPYTGNEQRFAPNAPPRPAAPRPELSFGPQIGPLSMGVAGTNGAVPPTKKQQERAVSAAVTKYNEDAKRLVADLVAAGMTEEAGMFADWMKEQGTQRGIKSAMKLGMAVTVGDTKAVEESLIEVYNNDQYFDDGYSIVPGSVKLTTGPDGRTITAAQFTLRNDATGEEFVQDAAGEDLGMLAYERADPFTVFQQGMAARQQANTDLYDIAKTEATEAAKARGKAAGEGLPTIAPDKAIETIEGAALTTPMTAEQKAALFERFTGGKYPGANPYGPASASGVGSSVPVARRPTE